MTADKQTESLKILIVDDEPIVRLDLKAMLKVQGYTVAGEAGDGLTAVDLCRNTTPDVVLMDVKMPVFDGLTAAETILIEKLSGCVILLTAFSDIAIIEQAKAIGISGYLVKPIDQNSLKTTIEVSYAQSRRLDMSQSEAADAKKRLQDQKLIRRAQGIIAKNEGVSETQAYQIIQKLAMNHSRSLSETAAVIVSNDEKTNVVKRAKRLLMERGGMTDEEAYRYIKKEAARSAQSLEQTASRLLKEYR